MLFFNTQTRLFCLSFFLVFVASCNENKDKKGKEKTNSGLEYFIDLKQDSTSQATPGDYCKIRLKYCTSTDSVLFDNTQSAEGIIFEYTPENDPAKFREAIGLLKEGEKGTFLIDAYTFFTKEKKEKLPVFILKGEKLKFEIELLKIIAKETVEKQKELQLIALKEKETKQIDEYLSLNYPDIPISTPFSKIIFLEKSTEKRNRPKTGENVLIHYSLFLLNGKLLDSSIERAEVFPFTLGDSTVIDGLNNAVFKMNKGEKARVLVPSNLAYGKEGISKWIPAYTPLIFEIELIDIH